MSIGTGVLAQHPLYSPLKERRINSWTVLQAGRKRDVMTVIRVVPSATPELLWCTPPLSMVSGCSGSSQQVGLNPGAVPLPAPTQCKDALSSSLSSSPVLIHILNCLSTFKKGVGKVISNVTENEKGIIFFPPRKKGSS